MQVLIYTTAQAVLMVRLFALCAFCLSQRDASLTTIHTDSHSKVVILLTNINEPGS